MPRLKFLVIVMLLLAATTADVEANNGYKHQEDQDRLHRKGGIVNCRGFISDWRGSSHWFIVVFFGEEKKA